MDIDKKTNSSEKVEETEKVESEIIDYKRIFYDKPDDIKEINDISYIMLSEEKSKKERRYIATFLVQSLICLIIIGSIIVTKYASPNTFVSVSSALNGLYENNITLSDLNRLIDEKILQNETLAAFFNMSEENSKNSKNGE